MSTIEIIKNSELDNEKLSHIFTPKNTPLDNVDFTKVIVEKPWGHEYLIYDDGNASIWVMHLRKGGSTSMHCHIYKKTALVVLKGKAITTTLNDGFMLGEGDGLVLDKKVFHATQAASDEETIVLELETPSKKTDVVRLVDLYGRESAGYESESKMIPGNSSEHVFFTSLETNIVKSIGNMHLSLNSFSEDFFLNYLSKDEVCIVLDGEVRDEKLRQVYKRGDLLRVQAPNNSLRTTKDSKILRISPTPSQAENIKAILFDFDGVLGDTMEDNYLAWKRTCEEYGASLAREEYFPFEGMPLKKIAQTIIDKNNLKDVSLETIVAKKEAYYKQYHRFSFYKGVPELIENLKRNSIKIAVVSAALRPRLFSSVPLDFLSKFDAIITGESVERGKPYPDQYLAAMKELGVSTDDCIIVENAPLGITSAKAAKAYCIAIASTMDKSYLSEADQVIDRFSDLFTLDKIQQLIKN